MDPYELANAVSVGILSRVDVVHASVGLRGCLGRHRDKDIC